MLATHGLFERANSFRELYGSERLENCVRAFRDKSAVEFISILYADVLRFAEGTSRKDDLSAIVIKRIWISVRETQQQVRIGGIRL